MIKVFGHKSPDTDATGSAIAWAWYLKFFQNEPATPYVLGELNPETEFVLKYWKTPKPEILVRLKDKERVTIVDTNNLEELPANFENAHLEQIIDHHRLIGNIKTNHVVSATIVPLASTASVIWSLMKPKERKHIPHKILGLLLSCILSDTLAFRSPTTTKYDKSVARKIARMLNIDIKGYATQMFDAKSDVSGYTPSALIKLDSKIAEINGKHYRVGVLETSSPKVILARKAELLKGQIEVCKEESLAEAFLFIIDILNEEATLLVPNTATKLMAEKTFGIKAKGDTVVIPGLVSRKKQIMPHLKV
jgi:manganese-dependent inorganic pyrophosphatase